jgi:hypothetical protein
MHQLTSVQRLGFLVRAQFDGSFKTLDRYFAGDMMLGHRLARGEYQPHYFEMWRLDQCGGDRFFQLGFERANIDYFAGYGMR